MSNNKHYTDILIATDGSEYSKMAVNSGIKFAKSSGAKVHAIYVINARWEREIYNYIRKKGEQATNEVKQLGDENNVEVKIQLLEGDPAERIIDYAENNDIDLIVMGTHGESGISRFLMGSVAQKVVRKSSTEVLISKI
ncbi:universal stress protein [Methanohalobium sp.]|uniref:universal stress protein n=1 Tax=Methanohalobium sp. TaxID=2837493 RepID=UPI0025D44403|nr:universal stress protein [Methanohalobium sp.]